MRHRNEKAVRSLRGRMSGLPIRSRTVIRLLLKLPFKFEDIIKPLKLNKFLNKAVGIFE